MRRLRGRLAVVSEETVGSELSAAASAGATELEVEDLDEFDWEAGGYVALEDETVAYSVDRENSVLSVAALTADHAEGTRVDIVPLTIERLASVMVADQEEELVARVPHALYDRIPVGVRENGEVVEIAPDDEGGMVVTDVIGQEPTVDGMYLDGSEEFFEKLRTLLLVTNTLKVPGETGQRLEIDQAGIRLYDGINEAPRVALNAEDGTANFKGTVDFGSDSHLLTEDVVELKQQPTSGFLTPALVQSKASKSSGGVASSSGTFNLDNPTNSGNLVLLAVLARSRGVGAPQFGAIAGWTQVKTVTNGLRRLALYRRDAGTPITQMPSVSFTVNADFIAQAFELSGVQVGIAHDKDASDSGSGATASTGTTGTPQAQTDELVFGLVGADQAINDESGYTARHDATTGGSEPSGAASVLALSAFRKNVTASAAHSVTPELSDPDDWLGLIATFRAKSAGNPATPDAGKVRLFAKQAKVGGNNRPHPHIINDAGEVRALGSPQFDQLNLSADYGIGTSLANVIGALATPFRQVLDNDGTYEVTLHAHINFVSGSPGKTDVGISVNGVDQPGYATTTHLVSRTTVSRTWKVSGLAGQFVQVRAMKAATGSVDLKATDTTLIVKQIA
jgi:hypothetical protein